MLVGFDAEEFSSGCWSSEERLGDEVPTRGNVHVVVPGGWTSTLYLLDLFIWTQMLERYTPTAQTVQQNARVIRIVGLSFIPAATFPERRIGYKALNARGA